MTAIAPIERHETEPAVATAECPTHRLTVAEFERMAAAGIFGETEPIYLWEGRLVEKMTKGDDHDYALTGLNTLLVRVVPAGWHVRPETPMQILDRGLPEPDLTVARGSHRDYKGRKPTAQDAALIVEVADSSLPVDSGEVLKVYAREAVPVYWIVDLPHRRIAVHSEPTGPADHSTYRAQRHYGPDDEVPVVLDGHEVGRIAVRDVLP